MIMGAFFCVSCGDDDDAPGGIGNTSLTSKTGLWRAYDASAGKWGYINSEGVMVISAQFDNAHDFSCGYAVVVSGGKYYFITEDGKMQKSFDGCEDFSNGFAVVKENGFKGLINTNLEYVIQPAYYDLDDVSTNGLLRYQIKSGDKVGYMTTDGKPAFDIKFDSGKDFRDGIAVVKSGTKYGAINAAGQYVINPTYEYLSSVGNGRLSYSNSTSSPYLYGLLDTNGNKITEPIYTDIYKDYFDIGLFAVGNQADKYGYINDRGDIVIKMDYYRATSFNGNYAEVLVASGSNRIVIDRSGNTVLVLGEGESVEDYRNGLYLIYKYDNKTYKSTYTYKNLDGKTIYSWTN